MNPYTVLDVRPDCSVDDIERQYRQLVALYRSQAGHDPERAERQLGELDDAYRVLSDTEMRRRYDQALAGGDAQTYPASVGPDRQPFPAYRPPPARYSRTVMYIVFLFVVLSAVALAYRIGVKGSNPFSFNEWSAHKLDKQMEPLRQRYKSLMVRVEAFEGPPPAYYDKDRAFAHIGLDTDVMRMQMDRNSAEDQIGQIRSGNPGFTPKTASDSMATLSDDMSRVERDLR